MCLKCTICGLCVQLADGGGERDAGVDASGHRRHVVHGRHVGYRSLVQPTGADDARDSCLTLVERPTLLLKLRHPTATTTALLLQTFT